MLNFSLSLILSSSSLLIKLQFLRHCFCSRPTALQDRTRDSDEEDLNDRDYDVAALANNLSQALRYKIYGNEGAEEVHLVMCCLSLSRSHLLNK